MRYNFIILTAVSLVIITNVYAMKNDGNNIPQSVPNQSSSRISRSNSKNSDGSGSLIMSPLIKTRIKRQSLSNFDCALETQDNSSFVVEGKERVEFVERKIASDQFAVLQNTIKREGLQLKSRQNTQDTQNKK